MALGGPIWVEQTLMLPITLGALVLENSIIATLSGVGTMGKPSPARTCLPSWPEIARSAKAAAGVKIRAAATRIVRKAMSPPRFFSLIKTTLAPASHKRKEQPRLTGAALFALRCSNPYE